MSKIIAGKRYYYRKLFSGNVHTVDVTKVRWPFAFCTWEIEDLDYGRAIYRRAGWRPTWRMWL